MGVRNPTITQLIDDGVPQGPVTSLDFTGVGVHASLIGLAGTVNIPGTTAVWVAITKDLGVAQRSGTFDITGLSGMGADFVVDIRQTAAKITSKGDARDEGEMDQILLTGYTVNSTTIRAYWCAPSIVVGTYAFAYIVGS